MSMPAQQKRIEVRPKNWWTPVALVLLREESSYGYELMERLQEFGFEGINAGTLYRTLRQMEKEGLCRSKWDTSEGHLARRMYSITRPTRASSRVQTAQASISGSRWSPNSSPSRP